VVMGAAEVVVVDNFVLDEGQTESTISSLTKDRQSPPFRP
jgi:hypothetical protein